jgi:hypothetical protein
MVGIPRSVTDKGICKDTFEAGELALGGFEAGAESLGFAEPAVLRCHAFPGLGLARDALASGAAAR